jgi:hypothetical protein
MGLRQAAGMFPLLSIGSNLIEDSAGEVADDDR